jgi:hypothetical protein
VSIKVETGVVSNTPSGPPKSKPNDMSGLIQRLARRLGIPATELAAKIPADTIRRTKYPVIEEQNGDGTTSFNNVPQIITAPRSSAST